MNPIFKNYALANLWDICLFFVSLIASGLIIYFIMKLIRVRYKYRFLFNITQPVILFTISMLLISLVVFASRFTMVFLGDNGSSLYNQAGSLVFAYSIYFLCWIQGAGMYLKNSLRLQKSFILGFSKILNMFSILVFLTGILGMLLMIGPIPQGSIFSEIIFAVIAVFSFLFFYLFLLELKVRQKEITGPYVKARIELFTWTVYVQLILGFVLFGGSLLLAFDLMQPSIGEFLVFSAMQLIAVSTSILLYNTVEIPNFIRKKYNLTAERFKLAMSG